MHISFVVNLYSEVFSFDTLFFQKLIITYFWKLFIVFIFVPLMEWRLFENYICISALFACFCREISIFRFNNSCNLHRFAFKLDCALFHFDLRFLFRLFHFAFNFPWYCNVSIVFVFTTSHFPVFSIGNLDFLLKALFNSPLSWKLLSAFLLLLL